jgi:hypothetical protein
VPLLLLDAADELPGEPDLVALHERIEHWHEDEFGAGARVHWIKG